MQAFLKNSLISITPPIIANPLKKILYRIKVVKSPFSYQDFRVSDRNVRSDEYIKWICWILGGWLTPDHGNIRAFDYTVKHMPARGAIIEVGSFLGLSTSIIAYLTIKYQRDNPFFTCDPWIFEGTEKPIGGYFDASSEAYRQYTKLIYKENVKLFIGERKPYTVEATSDQFFQLWNSEAAVKDVFERSVNLGGQISFAYIDGNHTYEAANKDFLNVNQHLIPGGFILFDDSADDSSFGVARVISEVKQNRSYELIFKTPNYLFRKTL